MIVRVDRSRSSPAEGGAQTVELDHDPGRSVEDVLAALRGDDLRAFFTAYHADPRAASAPGIWVVGTHAGVEAVLTTDAVSSAVTQPTEPTTAPSAGPETSALRRPDSPVLLFSDPPEHTRLRRAIGGALGRDITYFETDVQARLDQVIAASGDLMDDAILPATSSGLCALLGLPVDHAPQLSAWSRDASDLLDPMATSGAIRRGSSSGVRSLVTVKRAHDRLASADGAGALAALVAAEARGQVDEREVVTNVVSLLSAGLDTPIGLIGNAAVELARRPDLAHQLRDRPERVATFVEEIARLESPVQVITRTCREPFEAPFGPVDRGDALVLLLGCANRDPLVFDRPDELVLERRPNPHLAFGRGIHRCVGVGIGRAFAIAAVDAVLARWDELELDLERAVPRHHAVFRSYDHLPLRPGAA